MWNVECRIIEACALPRNATAFRYRELAAKTRRQKQASARLPTTTHQKPSISGSLCQVLPLQQHPSSLTLSVVIHDFKDKQSSVIP